MAVVTYDSVVSARTRTARQILSTPELLNRYLDAGGLAADLEAMVATGERAEVLAGARSQSAASGKGATAEVLLLFADLQRRYVAIMSVLPAVIMDIERAGGDLGLRTSLKQVLVNEAQVTVVTVQGESADGKKRKAVKSQGQEALRAEIAKDAAVLQRLTAAHAALQQRGMTLEKLQALERDAKALSGRLGGRTASKGAAKGATAEVHAAVREQKAIWGACYRMLAQVGQAEERVRAMLKEAARKRAA